MTTPFANAPRSRRLTAVLIVGAFAGATALAVFAARGVSAGIEAVIVGAGLLACAVMLSMWAIEERRRSSASDESSRLASRLEAAERRLALADAMVEGVLRSMEGGVVLLDAQHRVLSMNEAAESLLGAGGRATRGRLVQEAVRQPELNRFIDDAFAGRRDESELSILGAEERRVRAVARVFRDAGDRAAGLLLVLHDLTRLRRLEAVRTDFAANVSHELRTPITNIKGYVETLLELDPAADPVQTREFLRVVARNAERVSAIVDDLLMLAQLEKPGAPASLATAPTPMAPLADAVFADLAREASAKSIRLINEIEPGASANVNAQLIQQALANLVSNAIRYSPPGRRVWVRSGQTGGSSGESAEAGRVQLAVVDEGPGIAEEHLERIFERFYRVDKARSRETGGTGLGLAIVKHIVQLHGGRVEVESTLGQGSTFRMIL